jgi:hypothetical protein
MFQATEYRSHSAACIAIDIHTCSTRLRDRGKPKGKESYARHYSNLIDTPHIFFPCLTPASRRTMTFSCGVRSASELKARAIATNAGSIRDGLHPCPF